MPGGFARTSVPVPVDGSEQAEVLLHATSTSTIARAAALAAAGGASERGRRRVRGVGLARVLVDDVGLVSERGRSPPAQERWDWPDDDGPRLERLEPRGQAGSHTLRQPSQW